MKFRFGEGAEGTLNTSVTTAMIDQEKRAADLKRRKNQMLLFGGATLATLASCRLTARGISSRRCEYDTRQKRWIWVNTDKPAGCLM